MLVLGVVNSSPGAQEEDLRLDGRKGIGLSNIRQRLDSCYGDRARLDTRQTSTGYEAIIRLPFAEAVRPAARVGMLTPTGGAAVH